MDNIIGVGQSVEQDKQNSRYRARALARDRARHKSSLVRLKSEAKGLSIIMRRNYPGLADVLRRSNLLLKIKLPLLSITRRRFLIRGQLAMMKFARRLLSSNVMLSVPRGLIRILTRSQLKLLMLIVRKKQEQIEYALLQHRKSINRARILNSRASTADAALNPELSGTIAQRLNSYQLSLQNAADRARSGWIGMELDRFEAKIEYARSKARSLWAN